MASLSVLVLACVATLACTSPQTEPEPEPEPKVAEPSAVSGIEAPTPHAESSALEVPTATPETERTQFAEARRAIERALMLPGLPGAPQFEKNRPQLLARAKSEPVFFLRAPGHDPEATKGLLAQRQAFRRTDFAWRQLRELQKQFQRDKPRLRQIVLSEGYLYSESANHAFTLVSLVTPATLFDGEPIWIQRGANVFHAQPGDRGDYLYDDGPERGRRVRLLHLDRVGTGTPPEPLHVDFRALRYRLYFERAKVRHISDELLVADLRYGALWIPTLLRRNGAQLELEHELIEPEQRAALVEARERMARQLAVVSQLRSAMRAAIDEGLPFDEPKTEFGQEDGKLRRLWQRAYLSGQSSFKFNDDKYYVFGKEGQPLVPQVCIDFMVDTFLRASGSWWRPKSDGVRERTLGKLDWSEFDQEGLRRTQYFVELARSHPEWFEVLNFPKDRQVELGYKDQFFAWLLARVDDFDAGDMVLIRGHTPWDEFDEHTHSFFVYETDPMTGIPVAIAGNAGPANLWSWETEARRTPKRTLRTRIRPRLEWLETFLDNSARELEPPDLISGKK